MLLGALTRRRPTPYRRFNAHQNRSSRPDSPFTPHFIGARFGDGTVNFTIVQFVDSTVSFENAQSMGGGATS